MNHPFLILSTKLIYAVHFGLDPKTMNEREVATGIVLENLLHIIFGFSITFFFFLLMPLIRDEWEAPSVLGQTSLGPTLCIFKDKASYV